MQAVTEEQPNAKRSKTDEASGNEKETQKSNKEPNGGSKATKDSSEPVEPPKDYIHVRARRGQATDSHSLAERVCLTHSFAFCSFLHFSFRFMFTLLYHIYDEFYHMVRFEERKLVKG